MIGITFLEMRFPIPINSQLSEKQKGIFTVITMVKIKSNQSDKKNSPIFLYIFIVLL
jgi:hypothetical protein